MTLKVLSFSKLCLQCWVQADVVIAREITNRQILAVECDDVTFICNTYALRFCYEKVKESKDFTKWMKICSLKNCASLKSYLTLDLRSLIDDKWFLIIVAAFCRGLILLCVKAFYIIIPIDKILICFWHYHYKRDFLPI